MAVATNRERVHTYLLVKGAGPAERIIVWDTQDVSVGRSPENDLAIDDAALSRRHAEFYRADGGYAVKDLATSNGTTVNGETIRTRVLQNKDVVRFGDIEITFAQVAKNPAQIGKKVEFASQLKNFGGAAGQAKDGESTMLGLAPTLEAESDEDEFVVGKVNDFGDDLVDAKAPARRQAPRPAPRDLDLELGGLGDDLMEPPVAAASPMPAPVRAPAAKPTPRLAPQPSPEWSLDDVAEAPPVAKPQPRPPARVAAPAAAPAPVAAPAAAKAARRTVALQLEIQGLSGELQRAVEALLGKVIELPALRIRVKSDDLG